jgi:hypothetical protein
VLHDPDGHVFCLVTPIAGDAPEPVTPEPEPLTPGPGRA